MENMEMDMNTEMDTQMVEPHEHPPGTLPHSHANTSATVPPIQPGGGARIGCGMIVLME